MVPLVTRSHQVFSPLLVCMGTYRHTSVRLFVNAQTGITRTSVHKHTRTHTHAHTHTHTHTQTHTQTHLSVLQGHDAGVLCGADDVVVVVDPLDGLLTKALDAVSLRGWTHTHTHRHTDIRRETPTHIQTHT